MLPSGRCGYDIDRPATERHPRNTVHVTCRGWRQHFHIVSADWCQMRLANQRAGRSRSLAPSQTLPAASRACCSMRQVHAKVSRGDAGVYHFPTISPQFGFREALLAWKRTDTAQDGGECGQSQARRKGVCFLPRAQGSMHWHQAMQPVSQRRYCLCL